MQRLFTAVFWISIFATFLSSIWFALHGTIYFHTDIARDFLLIEDIVVNKKLALIGPHSGGIDGVFHGPAWLYLNAPAFMIGRGNPAVVGWFWALLIFISVGVVYWVTKKLSDTKTAMMATALYGLIIGTSAANLFNPFGAVLFAPLFIYFFILYIQKSKFIHLLISLFLIGIIIQFQMAWGVPILILSLPLLFRHFFIHKKFSHIFAFGILLIPLSTFILFDLRHQFLQAKSVLSYLSHTSTRIQGNYFTFIGGRLSDMFFSLINSYSSGDKTLQIVIFCTVVFIIYSLKNKKVFSLLYLRIFAYFYIGYWALTLLYKGTMWGYYTVPFIPLICMALAFLIRKLKKQLSPIIFILVTLPLLYMNIRFIYTHSGNYFRAGNGLWNMYLTQARAVFSDGSEDFGWYVYSADQYGYSHKYAMHYQQRLSKRHGFSYEKKTITYLLITPSTNRFTNADDWKKDKIKLTRTPDKVFTFQDGSYIEKYVLSSEEQKVPSASDLIQDLMFR
jgi:hypothetical protein